MTATPPTIPTAFFPPGTFPERVDGLVSGWYGKHLTAMGEPSLWAASARGETAYRFLWLRTWGRPLSVRVTRDGKRAHLAATRLTGDGGYDPGKVDVHRERDLTESEWQGLESAIAAASFDTIETQAEMGHDGAQWIIERSKDAHYRLVERWSPQTTGKHVTFRRACEVFLDLAGRDLVTGDVY